MVLAPDRTDAGEQTLHGVPLRRVSTFEGMNGVGLGIIADDLTGALDTGVQFSVRAVNSVVTLIERRHPDAVCLVVDTESRSIPPRMAEERVRRAARLLRGRLIYKKIDSTMRGNVGVELAATIQELGVHKALVAPAFPANGRTTSGGRLLVGHGSLERIGLTGASRGTADGPSVPDMLLSQMNEPIGLVGIDIVEQGAEAIPVP